jgi:tetratricopeptide (TPR) repeat protein
VDGPSVMRAALELYRGRQYPSVVAVCADALDNDPDNLHIRLLLARALLALRRDIEAQSHLRDCLRRDPRCAPAYRHLGELALRRDELESAKIFLREATRIDPDDRDASDLLAVVLELVRPNQPTAAVEKLPAATVAVGCPSPGSPSPPAIPSRRRRLALGTSSDAAGAEVPADGGFGHYLVNIGVLSPVQLRAALAYHRTTGVRVGRAAVALGFLSEPKVEWAALGFHGRRRG